MLDNSVYLCYNIFIKEVNRMINTLTITNGSGTSAVTVKTGKSPGTGQAVEIPNPSSYSVTLSDIDLDSKRSNGGVLHRNRVRAGVYSVACSWDWLNDDQIDLLLNSIKEKEFKLKFRDPLCKLNPQASSNNGYTEANVYAEGSKTAELVATSDEGKDYWKFSTTFVEY